MLYILTFRGTRYFQGAYLKYENVYKAAIYLKGEYDINETISVWKLKEGYHTGLCKDRVLYLNNHSFNNHRVSDVVKYDKELGLNVSKIYVVYNENADWIYFTTPFKAIEYIKNLDYYDEFSIYKYNIGTKIPNNCIKYMDDWLIWSNEFSSDESEEKYDYEDGR